MFSARKSLVALCAAVGFADGLTSDNVVGYMSKDMATAGYYNYTPMFVGVDGSNPAVKDIVPSSTEVTELGESKIKLIVLDTSRKFAKTFSYQTVDGDWADKDGWYTGGEDTETDYELEPGEVLQFYAPYQVKLSFPYQSL